MAGAVLGLVLGGGAAYAANEFTGKNIKNSSLKSLDVLNASLTGDDVKDGGLSGTDLLNGSITGADVADNSLNGDDVAPLNGDTDILDNTITTFDIATDAIDSDEVLDFGLSNEGIGVLFAQVAADGTNDNSSGSVTVTKLGTGTYEVDFGRDISNCAFTATIGPSGPSSASGQINVADRSGNANAVFVDTNDAAGASADRPFQLIVVC